MTKNLETPITSAIRKRALDARISLRELFRRANVASNILHTWEVMGRQPSDLTLAKINDVLDELEAGRGGN